MVLAADYPFLDVFWSMLIFFLWVALVHVAVPRHRRHLPPARCERREQDPLADLCALRPVPRRFRLPDRQQRRHGEAERRAGGQGAGPDGRVRPVGRRLAVRRARSRRPRGCSKAAPSISRSTTRSRPRRSPGPRASQVVRAWRRDSVSSGQAAATHAPSRSTSTATYTTNRKTNTALSEPKTSSKSANRLM